MASNPSANSNSKSATKTGIGQYLIHCVGVSPMLQNPMTDAVLDELTFGSAGRRKPVQKDVTIEDLAKQKMCLGPNEEFGIPANYLFAALVDAGRHVIFDKKTKLSTRESSLVPSVISIVPDLIDAKGDGFIPFTNQSEIKWIADRRRGVLTANGAAVAIIRPKFPTWAFDVTVEVNHDLVAVEKVQELFNAAGRYSGLGDFRPSKRGPFGRFSVKDFIEVEQELKAAA